VDATSTADRGARNLRAVETEPGHFALQERPAPSRARRRKPARRKGTTVVAVEPPPGRMALSVAEVAFVLGVSPNLVWGFLKDGLLEGFLLGNRRRIARSEVERFMRSGGSGGD
jgi:excisionase family DNA binding protein